MKPIEQRTRAVLRRVPKNGLIIEVGVLRGHMSQAMLRARPDIHLRMVDNWAHEDQQPEAYKATRDIHAHHDAARVRAHREDALRVVEAPRFLGRACVFEGTSVSAAGHTADASVDMVFLDADHSYEGVRADIEAWLPKVKPGGWIGGHDYANTDPAFAFGVDRAVDEWAARTDREIELDENFTWFSRC